jgi:hypothetical protein
MKPVNEQIDPKYMIQARKLTQFTQLLHNVLPIECRNHVEVANIRQQILMLITDSPVWTTRLRQLCPQILQYIRENSSKFDTSTSDSDSSKKQMIHHIQISTRYHTANASDQQQSSNKKRNIPQISKKTAELLSQSADSIDDPKLKTALQKIARHGNTDQGNINTDT